VKIAIVAPSPIPFVVGGAENLWMGLLTHFNQCQNVQAELVKVPVREDNLYRLAKAYLTFLELDLTHFDMVLSTKYPAWITQHHNHHVYLQHKLRGLYDTYPSSMSVSIKAVPDAITSVVKSLRVPAQTKSSVMDVLTQIIAYGDSEGEQSEAMSLPSPLARSLVHWLDEFAFSAQKIKSFSAISNTVKQRTGYFPKDTQPLVLHHPSSLQPAADTGQARYGFFTTSRHEESKRIDLLIAAFKRTKGLWTLRIAGQGPITAKLKQQAQPDTRIKFIGRVTDSQLALEYRTAKWVLFAPEEEDYGLVTIEALQAATPVIATTDSGGVTELIRHGENGLIVEPTITALTEAMQACIVGRFNSHEFGQQGQNDVSNISWDHLTNQLLRGQNRPQIASKNKHLVVVVPFQVWPAVGGGQERIYQLYRHLAPHHKITIVGLTGQRKDAGETRIAPNFNQILVAKSELHLAFERELCHQTGQSVTDIAAIEGYRKTPELVQVLARLASTADVFVASHPYLFYTIRDVWRGPVWYDAHNVEYTMKQAILSEASGAEDLLKQVWQVEQQACTQSDYVYTCSTDDAGQLQNFYHVSAEKCLLVPNGVDILASPFINESQKRGLKKRLGLTRFTAIFIGSWHGPNIEAAAWLKTLAHECPDIDIFILGSVCKHPLLDNAPDNIKLFGVVDANQKNILIQSANVALNPMAQGSGTNLKMLEYMSLGTLVLSTPFGNRGLVFQHKNHLLLANRSKFGSVIKSLQFGDNDFHIYPNNAYYACKSHYSWRSIARVLGTILN
jgi:glycosyltransferase involved in cell wall biosynthesis